MASPQRWERIPNGPLNAGESRGTSVVTEETVRSGLLLHGREEWIHFDLWPLTPCDRLIGNICWWIATWKYTADDSLKEFYK